MAIMEQQSEPQEWMLSNIPGLWKKGRGGRWRGSGWKVRGGIKKEVSRCEEREGETSRDSPRRREDGGGSVKDQGAFSTHQTPGNT